MRTKEGKLNIVVAGTGYVGIFDCDTAGSAPSCNCG